MAVDFVPLSYPRIATAMELRAELYRHEGIECHPVEVDLFRELIRDSSCGSLWLMEVDRQVVGYVLLTICYSLEFRGRFGLLDELYVDERWRGQGIGGAALEFVERESRARGLPAIRLEVSHTNLRALELYRRRGFVVDSRHLMTRWL